MFFLLAVIYLCSNPNKIELLIPRNSKENLSEPVGFTAYKSWLNKSSTCGPKELSDPVNSSSGTDIENSTSSEPAYPSSFAHIVELITTGQPIPGIEQIPDTVLTGHSISSEKPRRRKPWESGHQDKPQEEEAMLQTP